MENCVIILEKKGTINSNWVWGEEILAQALSQELNRFLECKIISEDELNTCYCNSKFDIAIHFREKFTTEVADMNILWLNNAIESFHNDLTFNEWIDRCIIQQIDKFDIIASVSKEWCELIRIHGGYSFFFPEFVNANIYKPTPNNYEAHDIVYVSNNIKGEIVNNEFIYPIAQYCADNEIDFAIYGADWEKAKRWKLIKPFYKKTLHPKFIPSVYSNSKIVLNIHFPSHRKFGILTSRVYEGLSCGTIVASDSVANYQDFNNKACFFANNKDDMIKNIKQILNMSESEIQKYKQSARHNIISSHTAKLRAEALFFEIKKLKH